MVSKESEAMLATGIIPEQYLRNIGTIKVAGQLQLLRSKVVIIGAGGLGGLVTELLARAGVGYLKVVDGDTFAAHNLNRQLFATHSTLGQNKAHSAAARVAEVNADVTVEAVPVMLDEANADSLLTGMDIVVDALDNIQIRLLLATTAGELGLPLVHAAIAGFTGQVMTIMPGDKGLQEIYKSAGQTNRGIETLLGNPPPTPAIAAALEVQEVIKVLTGIGEPIRNKLLYFDLEHNIFEFIKFTER